MRTWFPLISLIILVAVTVAAGCSISSSSKPSAETTRAGPSVDIKDPSSVSEGSLSLSVDFLEPGDVIPDIYTCKGTRESPEASWEGIPDGSKSLVLILEDPDAPSGLFTHWIVYNLPPVAGNLNDTLRSDTTIGDGIHQAQNTAGSYGYYPPCPPVGTTHRYIFRLYALDTGITQFPVNREAIDSAMKGHILGSTGFETVFSR